MSGYILAPAAQEDLVAIRDYYLKEASYRIARQMLAIAKTPGIGHKREDLAENRPVLFWRTRDYLIVYRAATDQVEIVTIARGSRDIVTILKRLGP